MIRNAIEQADATELVESGTARLSLMVTEAGLINDVIIDRVITPNGDDANETLDVQFTLLKVNEERPVDVSFYDLSGRVVGHGRPSPAGPALAELGTTDEDSGEVPSVGKAGVLRFSWNGRDEGGDLVPPGIYVVRVRVEADNGDRDIVRTVNVVY